MSALWLVCGVRFCLQQVWHCILNCITTVINSILIPSDIAAVAKCIDDPVVRCAIDGSLYKKHPKMRKLLDDFVAELAPNKKIEIFLADGGSGKGSAFIAAVAAKRRQDSWCCFLVLRKNVLYRLSRFIVRWIGIYGVLSHNLKIY